MKKSAYGNYGQEFELKTRECLLFPDGLKVCLSGHSHKQQQQGDPSKEISEIEVSFGKEKDKVYLGHTVWPGSPKAIEEWDKKVWKNYEFELKGMTYSIHSTLVIRKLK